MWTTALSGWIRLHEFGQVRLGGGGCFFLGRAVELSLALAEDSVRVEGFRMS